MILIMVWYGCNLGAAGFFVVVFLRDVVKSLLHYEASLSVLDNRGCLPLHLAAWNGHHVICEELLSHQAALARANEQNYEGATALLCAAQHGHTHVVDILVKVTIRHIEHSHTLTVDMFI